MLLTVAEDRFPGPFEVKVFVGVLKMHSKFQTKLANFLGADKPPVEVAVGEL